MTHAPGEDRVQQALARWRALPDDDPWREDIEVIYARLRAVEGSNEQCLDALQATAKDAVRFQDRLREVEGERDREREIAEAHLTVLRHAEQRVAAARALIAEHLASMKEAAVDGTNTWNDLVAIDAALTPPTPAPREQG